MRDVCMHSKSAWAVFEPRPKPTAADSVQYTMLQQTHLLLQLASMPTNILDTGNWVTLPTDSNIPFTALISVFLKSGLQHKHGKVQIKKVQSLELHHE